jgi:endonuclease YncB( thermonuclease family)
VEFSGENATAVAASTAVGEIVGRASVKDGDTIEIHGEPIRILDIDATAIAAFQGS